LRGIFDPPATRPNVVVYGATPAGIESAIRAARQGCKVTIFEPTDYIGGMTAGGISRTDWRAASLSYRLMGSATAEFYQRAAAMLGISSYDAIVAQWNLPCSIFRQMFNTMLSEAGITVHTGYRLTSVTKPAAKITAATFTHRTSGDVVTVSSAAEYIDASYEGDFLPAASITYFAGREANATYSETVNGVRASTATTYSPIDGYVTPATPASGVLPNIISAEMPASGTADTNYQAFCHRPSLTSDPAWRIPFPQPASYNALNYEFLGRRFAASPPANLDAIFLKSPVTGISGEVREDWNEKYGFTIDVANLCQPYPDGSWATRDTIVQTYKDYHLGLFKWLSEDSRVPSAVKTELASWGFIRGEFDDLSGLSYQLYVRSGRRMRGRAVLTQSDVTAPGAVSNPIGYSVYPLDTHFCSLRQTSASGLKAEGLTGQTVSKPAPVSGDCILPQATECTNLQVIYCGSFTHVAYASLRIEPSMQTLGEAAGLRAAYAVHHAAQSGDVAASAIVSDLGIAVQPTNYLAITGTANLTDGTVQTQANGTITVAGAWTYFTSAFGYVESGAFHDNSNGKGTKSIKYTLAAGVLGGAGSKTIYLNDPGSTNASTNVSIDIHHNGVTDTVVVDLKTGDWVWKALGTYTFADDGTDYVMIKNAGTTAGTYVLANAIGWN
jgi:hypothetical protein